MVRVSPCRTTLLVPIVFLFLPPAIFCFLGKVLVTETKKPFYSQRGPHEYLKSFEANEIQILRVIGRVEVEVSKSFLADTVRELDKFTKLNFNTELDVEQLLSRGRATTFRIFEAKLTDGTKCFIKEYFPIGFPFGRRELSASKRITNFWLSDTENLSEEDVPPIPTLLGSLRTDERISNPDFRSKWVKKFPAARPPDAGNLWLVFKWDETSFRNLKLYPSLPQFVEGWDYFSRERRMEKRWRFIRKMIRKSLELIDLLHRSGYSHNAISSETLWLTTTNQIEIDRLNVKVSDLGGCQRFADLGPQSARVARYEDYYRLGFVLLELIVSSFNEDNRGAQMMRRRLGSENAITIFTRAEDINYKQFSNKEFQSLFENQCSSDFATFLEEIRSIENWDEAISYIEAEDASAGKIILTLLARGKLRQDMQPSPVPRMDGRGGRWSERDGNAANSDEIDSSYGGVGKLLKVTGRSIVEEHVDFFRDTF